MNILYTASEALPFIASGGLADVAGSLPAAINAEGHDCRVVIPYYSSIRQELKDKLTYVTNFTVPVAWRNQYCGVFTGVVNGVTYYLLDNEYTSRETVCMAFMMMLRDLYSSQGQFSSC